MSLHILRHGASVNRLAGIAQGQALSPANEPCKLANGLSTGSVASHHSSSIVMGAVRTTRKGVILPIETTESDTHSSSDSAQHTKKGDYPVKKIAVLTTILALLVLPLSVRPVLAAPGGPPHLNWGSELNADQCPQGELVINVTHKVVNDIDSAVGGGFWATDTYNRHIQVWEVAPGTFCAVVRYTGQFVTDDGPSPQGTDIDGIAAGITGTFEGGYRSTIFSGTLNPGPAYRTRGNIGAFDYGCDVENDPGDYSSCTGLFSWVGTYFTSTSGFDLEWWGWVYHSGDNGTWVNSGDGNEGDITD